MTRALASFALLLLAACSSQPGTPDEGRAGFRGDMDLRACGNAAPTPLLVRGNTEAAPGIIAAVCGNLEGHNTLTLKSGALAVSGDWTASAPARVGGAAFVNGKLEASNSVTIDGVLHTSAADLTNVTASSVTAVGVAPDTPVQCASAPVSRAAIAQIEAAGMIDMGDALAAHSESANVELGCARYRFSSWGINNELLLRVTGSTVIVVEGDVRIAAPVRIDVAPDAKLDFIVGGSLQVDNTLSFSGGSTWLGVEKEVRIAAPVTLTGYLFAPLSQVALDNTLTIDGSLFVGPLRAAAPLTVTALPGSEPACATTF